MENKKFINGKLYGVCGECAKIIRIDKPFVGSMHICESEEYKHYVKTEPQFRGWHEEKVKESLKLLNNQC